MSTSELRRGMSMLGLRRNSSGQQRGPRNWCSQPGSSTQASSQPPHLPKVRVNAAPRHKALARAPPRPGAHPQHGGKARQGQKVGESSCDSFRPKAQSARRFVLRCSSVGSRHISAGRNIGSRHQYRRAFNRHGCYCGWTVEVAILLHSQASPTQRRPSLGKAIEDNGVEDRLGTSYSTVLVVGVRSRWAG